MHVPVLGVEGCSAYRARWTTHYKIKRHIGEYWIKIVRSRDGRVVSRGMKSDGMAVRGASRYS